MQNFKPLTDVAKLNKKPERVRLKTTTSDGTLEQTLRKLSVPNARLEEMAVLNGMKLGDQIKKGTLLKVIQL